MFVFSEKAYVIHHMAALVQSSRATASFRIPAGSFHSCQPTRKKARVMDKIRGRNKAITMHSTPVYRGQGRIYANKRILPIPIHEISLYFGISRSSLGRTIAAALISRIGRRCRALFLTASKRNCSFDIGHLPSIRQPFCNRFQVHGFKGRLLIWFTVSNEAG